MMAKMFIYSQKCKNEKPVFNCFKNYVIGIIELEKQIAVKNDKVPLHQAKWRDILL